MASKNWAKKVAQIKARQMVREMAYAERIAYIQAQNGIAPTVKQPAAQPTQSQIENTCPCGGAH